MVSSDEKSEHALFLQLVRLCLQRIACDSSSKHMRCSDVYSPLKVSIVGAALQRSILDYKHEADVGMRVKRVIVEGMFNTAAHTPDENENSSEGDLYLPICHFVRVISRPSSPRVFSARWSAQK